MRFPGRPSSPVEGPSGPAATRRPRGRRRAGIATVAAVALSLAGSAVASADDANTLTVVGTSDVSDSNLVQQVLKPGFEAANPQYTLNYVSKGTGAAIQFAQAGTASALIVHAASLENQFVGQGYSAEPYGRAIFWGDYVLAGKADDPAGVGTADAHDVVGAYERIAAAGAAGKAEFVSRGGTPGTTVQEHAIWALTSGVTTCKVSDANGGGASPSTTGGDCPATISYPSWYHATGLTQGPNITAADTCNGYASTECYVFTDRGTLKYLQSTGAATSLKILTRNNDATARGTTNALVNSFHAYAVNPDKFTGSTKTGINLTAATAFLNWVTSPAAQAAVAKFLATDNDPPFVPSAAPTLTGSTVPASVNAGGTITVTGKLTNVVPGTPALAGKTVTLAALSPAATPVATATTDANGAYSITYKPGATSAYSVSTPQLTQIENASLTPTFGDLLAPTSTAVGSTTVVQPAGTPAPVFVPPTTKPTTTTKLARVRLSKATIRKGVLTLKGTLASKAARSGTRVQLRGRKTLRLATSRRKSAKIKGSLRVLTTKTVAKGGRSFTIKKRLTRGYRWQLRLRYTSPGTTSTSSSGTKTVTVR